MGNSLEESGYFIVDLFTDTETSMEYSPEDQQFRLHDRNPDIVIYLTLEEVQRFFDPAPKYIVVNKRPIEGSALAPNTLFWSNDFGWVDVEGNVAVYSKDEHHAHNLPMGGYWFNIFS